MLWTQEHSRKRLDLRHLRGDRMRCGLRKRILMVTLSLLGWANIGRGQWHEDVWPTTSRIRYDVTNYVTESVYIQTKVDVWTQTSTTNYIPVVVKPLGYRWDLDWRYWILYEQGNLSSIATNYRCWTNEWKSYIGSYRPQASVFSYDYSLLNESERLPSTASIAYTNTMVWTNNGIVSWMTTIVARTETTNFGVSKVDLNLDVADLWAIDIFDALKERYYAICHKLMSDPTGESVSIAITNIVPGTRHYARQPNAALLSRYLRQNLGAASWYIGGGGGGGDPVWETRTCYKHWILNRASDYIDHTQLDGADSLDTWFSGGTNTFPAMTATAVLGRVGAPTNWFAWTPYRALGGKGPEALYGHTITTSWTIACGATDTVTRTTSCYLAESHVITGTNGQVLTAICTNANVLAGRTEGEYGYYYARSTVTNLTLTDCAIGSVASDWWAKIDESNKWVWTAGLTNYGVTPADVSGYAPVIAACIASTPVQSRDVNYPAKYTTWTAGFTQTNDPGEPTTNGYMVWSAVALTRFAYVSNSVALSTNISKVADVYIRPTSNTIFTAHGDANIEPVDLYHYYASSPATASEYILVQVGDTSGVCPTAFLPCAPENNGVAYGYRLDNTAGLIGTNKTLMLLRPEYNYK